jgi:hypothetical protein
VACTVCLSAHSLHLSDQGGHRWVFLNWALGLRALGCNVVWLEAVPTGMPDRDLEAAVAVLRRDVAPYGLDDCVALCDATGGELPPEAGAGSINLEAAACADLLLNLRYALPHAVVARFRRSAFVDIDPGLLQLWMRDRLVTVAPHDVYFTIGETVGDAASGIPDVDVVWHYTQPCVALDWWPCTQAPAGARFSTLANWWAGSWIGDDPDRETKRSGFLHFLDLPARTSQPLELGLNFGETDWTATAEEESLRAKGWCVRRGSDVAATTADYQQYIQRSLGEFSCAKPSCLRLQNAWISDRTLCYLASGKPAIVQHTGPSRFLPDAGGLFRFRTLEDAAISLDAVANDYDHQCRLARSLAEEFFDARTVVRRLLERAL